MLLALPRDSNPCFRRERAKIPREALRRRANSRRVGGKKDRSPTHGYEARREAALAASPRVGDDSRFRLLKVRAAPAAWHAGGDRHFYRRNEQGPWRGCDH